MKRASISMPLGSRHCPRWIRTTILGSKVRCPAIGRGGSEPLKLPIHGHAFNSITGPGRDHAHSCAEADRGDVSRTVEDAEHGRSRAGEHGDRSARGPEVVHEAADVRVAASDDRAE